MNKILTIGLCLSFNIYANEAKQVSYGRVVELKGAGFISFEGKTREIKKGDSIDSGSEIVIENQGQVTFTDNADHRFHLGNSSSVFVKGTVVELRAGDLWFQSLNKNDDYQVKTVNALVNYQGGEAILSYDSVKGKTQLMVINNMMKLSNLRSPELNLNISEGNFSFIDNAYDEGAPRDPTRVGEKTYGQLVGLFNGVSPMEKDSSAIFKGHDHSEVNNHTSAASREIASVESVAKAKNRIDYSVDSKLMEDYKNELFNKSAKKVTKTTKKVTVDKIKKVKAEKIAIHIYGQVVAENKSRAPASVVDQEVPMDSQVAPAQVISPYSKDYKNQYKESDKLLEDLKKL